MNDCDLETFTIINLDNLQRKVSFQMETKLLGTDFFSL